MAVHDAVRRAMNAQLTALAPQIQEAVEKQRAAQSAADQWQAHLNQLREDRQALQDALNAREEPALEQPKLDEPTTEEKPDA